MHRRRVKCCSTGSLLETYCAPGGTQHQTNTPSPPGLRVVVRIRGSTSGRASSIRLCGFSGGAPVVCTNDTGRGFSRRRFIAHSAAAIAALVSPAAFARYTQSGYRRLRFRHLHTGESLTVTYWENGRYLPDALGEINYLLRDHRSDDVHPIAPRLLDTLNALQTSMEFNAPYEVISGFRSRATNEKRPSTCAWRVRTSSRCVPRRWPCRREAWAIIRAPASSTSTSGGFGPGECCRGRVSGVRR